MVRSSFIGMFLLVYCAAIAQCPSISFSSKSTQYCISDFIDIEAYGVPAGSTVAWDIGTGWDTAGTSYLVSPSSAGPLTVQLQISTPSGAICTYDSSAIVQVNPLPTPAYSVSTNKLCAGAENIIFTDETTHSAKRTWLVNGDRFLDVNVISSLPINKLGYSDITLIVEDSIGCRNVKTWNNAIIAYNDIELDIVKSNTDNCIPVSTNFTLTSTPIGQTITSYLWTLPGSDKSGATTATVSAANYTTIGNFNTRLEVSTNRGCTYTVTKNRLMTIGDTANIAVQASKSILCLSEQVTLTQTRQPLDGVLTWDIPSATENFNSKYQGEFTFRDTGFFSLELMYDHNNCISTITENNLLYVSGQKATFSSPNNFHCEAPHSVDLINTSDTSSGPISAYEWIITDAQTGMVLSTAATKDHTITINKDPSSYHVKLITTSASGCKDTAEQLDFVYIRPYQFNFISRPEVGCVDQNFRYINRTKSSSYYGLDLFSWDFYNEDKSAILGSSAATSPTFNYSSTGYYNTQLTAANPLGCQQIKMLDSAVRVVEPNLGVAIEDSILCVADPSLFKGISTPLHPSFRSLYSFTHVSSGQQISYTGDSILASLPEIGLYLLKYHYGTATTCTDTLERNIYTNGIEGSILIDTFSGCSPLEIHPTFVVDQNVHKGNSDSKLEYNWDVTPRSGATILGASSPSPTIILENDLNYTISVYVSNSTGCGFYTTSNPISLGVKAGLSSNKDNVCVGDSIIFTNTTQNNPNINKWEVLTNRGHRKDSISPTEYQLTLLDTGEYRLRLIVSKDAVCTDTVYKNVYATELTAAFELANTNLGCAPVIATFINTSRGADSIYWSFGDGNLVASKFEDTTYHTYADNSDTSGFDIELITVSNAGCRDTISKLKALILSGPIAHFDIVDGLGCEPNLVTFVNNSKNYDSLFFSYGAALPQDTNVINSHTYWNNTENITKAETPMMRLIDNNGCEAIFEIEKGVQTNNVPIINLNIDSNDVYCQRQIIEISDTGKYSSSWNWYINDKLILRRKEGSFTLEDEGINELKLITTNSLGCSDTAYRSFNTEKTTDIDFEFPEIICPNELTKVTANYDILTPPLSLSWRMGELGTENNEQNSADDTALIAYRFPGMKKVVLLMTLPNGCTIADSTELEVFNSDAIKKLELTYVQFSDDNTIETRFTRFNLPYFQHINIYRNTDLVRSDTTYRFGILLDSTYDSALKNCYNLSITDICGVEGEKGRTHCPVNLEVSQNVSRQVQLDWTYYIGWDRVDGYEIARQYPDSSYQVLDTVFSTQRTYTDSFNVCDVDYNYKVSALKGSSSIKSQSNTASIKPFIDTNTSVINLDNISVTNNDLIELRWQPSTYRYNREYLLTKHAAEIGNIIDSIWLADTLISHQDSDNVTPELFHYYYNLYQVDNCKKLTKNSKYAKTILLTGENTEMQSRLNWTPYLGWDYAIKEHHVVNLSATGNNYLGQVSPTTFTFLDGSFYEDINGYYLYQMYSVNTNGDTSYSNLAYISGNGRVFSPNSFSPNGDGLNDVFSFQTLFVTSESDNQGSDFEFEVYNRWGERVHVSNNLSLPWDGTYKGEIIDAGVYHYTVKFTDGKKQTTYNSGIIHVIR